MQIIVPRQQDSDRDPTIERTDEWGVPVAAAKVRIPNNAAVVRDRLHALLDDAVCGAGADRPVTIVCAPAGSGKTTLLATWARQHAERRDTRIAWVSLDGEDNDPVLLWSAVLRALRAAGAYGQQGPLGMRFPN